MRLHRLVGQREGYGDVASAVRGARDARGDQAGAGVSPMRWIIMQGTDRRFYLYEGEIEPAATTEVETTPAIAVYVFATHFVTWRVNDAVSWRAHLDEAPN